MARQALTIAPRYAKPAIFNGTDAAWRVLCDLYPSAETPDVLMALMEYCAVRKLDPYKRPVHIVPMWNTRAGRQVQVVMQGINELEITAARSNEWVGADEPIWGPEVKRKFVGVREDRDGRETRTEIEMTFPLWATVAIYRFKHGEKRRFADQVFWPECYGRAGFRSELPNERWSKAPYQMLAKCAKASALRMAFPEDVGYAAEEMEGHETDGGITIDGSAHEPPPTPRPPPSLSGSGGPQWPHPPLPTSHSSTSTEGPKQEAPSDDPCDKLIAEVEAMDIFALDRSHTDATFMSRLRALFPPDQERVEERMADRHRELHEQAKQPATDPLMEPQSTQWLRNFLAECERAQSATQAFKISNHPMVRGAQQKAPTLIRQQIQDALRQMFDRLGEVPDPTVNGPGG